MEWGCRLEASDVLLLQALTRELFCTWGGICYQKVVFGKINCFFFTVTVTHVLHPITAQCEGNNGCQWSTHLSRSTDTGASSHKPGSGTNSGQ